MINARQLQKKLKENEMKESQGDFSQPSGYKHLHKSNHKVNSAKLNSTIQIVTAPCLLQAYPQAHNETNAFSMPCPMENCKWIGEMNSYEVNIKWNPYLDGCGTYWITTTSCCPKWKGLTLSPGPLRWRSTVILFYFTSDCRNIAWRNTHIS